MKNLFLKILVLTVIIFIALNIQFCTQRTDGFIIKGEIHGAGLKKIILTKISYLTDIQVSDSTVADKNGKFVFSGKEQDGASPYMLTVEGQNRVKVFILCNSKISISGKVDSLYNAKIIGSKEEDLSQKIDSISLYTQFNNLEKARYSAFEINDTAKLHEIDFQKEELIQKRNIAYKNFIKTNPSAYMSAFILVDFINSHLFEEAEELYNIIASSNYSNKVVLDYFKNIIETRKNVTVGKTAPDFTQPDIFGNPVTLSEFRGNYVLLDFWASWCSPCRKENPNLLNLYNKYRNSKFTIISVSIEENKNDWLNAIKKDNMSWTNVSDLKGKDNLAKKIYGVIGIPEKFLIDPEGKIIANLKYGDNLEKTLTEFIK